MISGTCSYVVCNLPTVIFFITLSTISCWRHLVFGLSVCVSVCDHVRSLWTQYSTSHSWEFRQTYNRGTVEDKDELVSFEVKRSKVKLRPNMTTWALWEAYLANLLWEFHQIHKLSAVGDKTKVIGFLGQQVEGQGHAENKYGQTSFGQKCTFSVRAYWLTVRCQRPSSLVL